MGRVGFLDNLKMVLVMLVVAHHAGQPYGPTGGRWPLTHPVQERMLGPFFHVNASFFMGLFFLISAYFLPISYDRKGPRRFLAERLTGLGPVVLAFPLAIFPAMLWALSKEGLSFGQYWVWEIIERKHLEFGHVWFLTHLVVYAVLYVLWRKWRGPLEAVRRETPFPSSWAIAGYALALGAVSVAVRIWFPIDKWVFIGVPAEIAHLPQYGSLFVLGIVGYRRGWLPEVPARAGRLWLGIGMGPAAFRYCYTGFRWRFLKGLPWIWPMWEGFLAIGMCIGWIWFFREYWPGTNALGRFLNRNAYFVYLAHLPVVVVAQMALAGSGLGPVMLTIASTLTTVVACYLLAVLVRLIPGSERVL